MMGNNPYNNPQGLADALWELEAVADKYAEGNLILIKTKDGWKAHLGGLKDELQPKLEKALDMKICRNYLLWTESGYLAEIPRHISLLDEIWELLPDCVSLVDYYPMKLTEDQQKLIETKKEQDSNDEDIPF
jgi:hypothetical protein